VIAVIGAGLIGLAIAYELRKRGADVGVLDAGEPMGGASWAGAGMLAPDTEALPSGALRAFCARSLGLYPEFVAALQEDGGVDARLRLDGILNVATSQDGVEDMRARAAALRDEGIAARWLPRSEALALEPAVAGSALGGLLVEREGQVDNRRLGRALRAACERIGVAVVEQQGRVQLEADGRRVRGLRIRDGFMPADVAINATGAWAGELAGVPEQARVPVYPVKGQMLALAMPRGLVRRVVWYPGGYAVPRDDGRLLVGATVEDAGIDVRVTAAGQRRLLDAALDALPALRDLAIVETWAGARPASPDGLPYVGATSVEGYFVASGHYRNGILLVPATAEAVADAVEGVERPDLAAFAPARAWRDGAGRPAANQSA
jgi:glycine oxidase